MSRRFFSLLAPRTARYPSLAPHTRGDVYGYSTTTQTETDGDTRRHTGLHTDGHRPASYRHDVSRPGGGDLPVGASVCAREEQSKAAGLAGWLTLRVREKKRRKTRELSVH